MAEREREAREERKGFVEAGLPAGGAFGPAPEAADLALINARYALAPLAAEELYVRRMVLANDALDRTYERFPPAVLERFAQTLPGKPVLIAHDKSELPIGVIYRAAVRPARDGEAGQYSLEAALYMRRTAANAEVRGQIDAGVIRAVSIGFRHDMRLCSVCGADYFDCPHDPGEVVPAGAADGTLVTYTYAGDLARYEACECSLVYLGCQQQAAIVKGRGLGVGSSARAPYRKSIEQEHEQEHEEDGKCQRPTLNAQQGGTTMEQEKVLARVRELEGEVQRLGEELAAAKTRVEAGAHEAGEEVSPESLVLTPDSGALAADGKAYRQHLRAEVQRLAGILKSEAEASLLLKALPHAPVAALQELLASYQTRVEEKFPPRPLGDPTPPTAASRPAPEVSGPERPFRFS